MMNKLAIFSILLVFSILPVFAQAAGRTPPATAAAPAAGTAAATPGVADDTKLPTQFRQLTLGMGLDDLKNELLKDDLFLFRGDRDVSLLPAREQSLVETTGASFIKRAFFQLRDGKVFIMAFTLNTEVIDHYSIFTQFVQKYGQPTYLDPSVSVWETDDTRIAIERPLTVKYIDRTVFNDIVNESGLIESGHVKLRQDFINEF